MNDDRDPRILIEACADEYGPSFPTVRIEFRASADNAVSYTPILMVVDRWNITKVHAFLARAISECLFHLLVILIRAYMMNFCEFLNRCN